MNILWIVGQICKAIFILSALLFFLDRNEKRYKLWFSIGAVATFIFIVLFIIRMTQIITILNYE